MAEGLTNLVEQAAPLPEEDVHEAREGVSLARRLRDPKTILSFVVGVLLLVTVFRRLGDLSDAAQTIRQVNVGLYLLAFVA